jgi:ribosomal protein S6
MHIKEAHYHSSNVEKKETLTQDLQFFYKRAQKLVAVIVINAEKY